MATLNTQVDRNQAITESGYKGERRVRVKGG